MPHRYFTTDLASLKNLHYRRDLDWGVKTSNRPKADAA